MRETAHVLALLGGADRRGAWAPADRVRVVAIMGGAKLDLREAELLEGETEITVFALMGGVQILVPDDVHVEADGIGLMGGFGQAHHRADDPDAPRLRVRGIAIMGGVELKVRPAR